MHVTMYSRPFGNRLCEYNNMHIKNKRVFGQLAYIALTGNGYGIDSKELLYKIRFGVSIEASRGTFIASVPTCTVTQAIVLISTYHHQSQADFF